MTIGRGSEEEDRGNANVPYGKPEVDLLRYVSFRHPGAAYLTVFKARSLATQLRSAR